VGDQVTAAYDQALAHADRELDSVVEALRKRIGEAGEIQAMADLVPALAGLNELQRFGLLTAAIGRLARAAGERR
jgi:hypothetical protein